MNRTGLNPATLARNVVSLWANGVVLPKVKSSHLGDEVGNHLRNLPILGGGVRFYDPPLQSPSGSEAGKAGGWFSPAFGGSWRIWGWRRYHGDAGGTDCWVGQAKPILFLRSRPDASALRAKHLDTTELDSALTLKVMNLEAYNKQYHIAI